MDGTLELLGRIDDQFKIKGIRLEPVEIEGLVLEYPGIKETVVLPQKNDNGNPYLCAYVVWENEKDIKIPPLKQYLATENGKNIFCFPPAQGFGLQYGALAFHLPGNSIYAFNFLDN